MEPYKQAVTKLSKLVRIGEIWGSRSDPAEDSSNMEYDTILEHENEGIMILWNFRNYSLNNTA